MSEERDRLHRQLVTLGDMMGDGLHYEDKSISREYRSVARQLYPEMFRVGQKAKNENLDRIIQAYFKVTKCECGGTFKQVRSGSTVANCLQCKKRVKVRQRTV